MCPDTYDVPYVQGEDAGERDPDLDARFARAREHRPTPEQWERMLRAVRVEAKSRGAHLWRIGVPLGAAAGVLAAAIILFAPPAHRSAFALTRVAEAMRAVGVLQRESSDGSVCWESPGRCFAARAAEGRRYEYRDFVRETMTTYEPARGCIIRSSCDTPQVPQGLTGAHTLDELIQTAESWGQSFDERWERRDRIENGRPIIELTTKQADVWLRAVTIDGESGRIVRTESDEGSVAYLYPDHSPQDLYDLGVPRDVAVIDGTAPPQVLALRDQVREGSRRGFGAYRLVRVSWCETARLITDGRRWREDSLPVDPNRPCRLDELWSRAHEYDHMDSLAGEATLTHVLVGDAEQTVYFDDRGQVRERIVRPKELAFVLMGTLEARLNWGADPEVFFGLWGDEQCEALGPDEHGWVGFRLRGQANRVSRPYCRDRWYDPVHAYTLCNMSGYEDPDAEWQLTAAWQKEYEAYTAGPVKPPADAPASGGSWEVVEWAELRPGAWYPTVSRCRALERAADGSWYRCAPDPADVPSTGYWLLLATALDAVDDHWFEIPPEWLAVPARPH
jgi:hypothetical protein